MPRPNSSHTGKRRRNRDRVRRTTPPRLSDIARKEIQDIIGFKFKDLTLLDRAFTHTSSVPGEAADWSNERLEFLGDRVLGLVVASQLISRFEKEREGGLAPRLNALVSRDTCAKIAADIGFGQYLILDASEASRGGAEKTSLLADVAESVIGAIYLDAGLKASEAFIVKYWKEYFKTLTRAPRDPKSALQEWAQKDGRPAPVYESINRTGPDHAPVFTIEVRVEGVVPAAGDGASKQEAERAAASAMLENLGESVE